MRRECAIVPLLARNTSMTRFSFENRKRREREKKNSPYIYTANINAKYTIYSINIYTSMFVFVCVQFSNTMVFILFPPGLVLYQDLHRVFALHQNTHHCLFCERILCALCVRVGCLHFACWKAPAMQTIFPPRPNVLQRRNQLKRPSEYRINAGH